jgi:tetratricopeptide (TPR) repeat protein
MDARAGDTGRAQELQSLTNLVRTRRYDAAIEGLRAFLTRFPDDEVATGLLAATYFEIGLAAKALAGYERVLEINPANALARFQLGMVHVSRGEHQAALERWKPLTRDPREFMARFHSALACMELGDAPQARSLLEEAAKNMPVGHPLFPQLKALRARLADDATHRNGLPQ